ncbi:hypothetical protein P154DRAFT_565467 [Amniculicola lignicola CBS 123094]|uniref:Uncharacterized protein n=1 Tax=Amniculicola lignicola CBS 123094 TaxID=1392246 RepID=A0A6A5W8V6_9PLEO|nr:hypothetical protein P154DRAFT_565467 [Amniculicola lignicola CBS 123094]
MVLDCGIFKIFRLRKRAETQATSAQDTQAKHVTTPKAETKVKVNRRQALISKSLSIAGFILSRRGGEETSIEETSIDEDDGEEELQVVRDKEIKDCERKMEAKRNELTAINDRKRQLDSERRDLQNQACILLREFKARDKDMGASIEAYSKACHLQFSAILFKKLPLELRRLVYDAILADLPTKLINLEKGKEHPLIKTLPQNLLQHPCVLPSYVGLSVSREFVERIYESCTFRTKSLSIASWFLRTDIFNLDVIPKLHIRHLLVNVYSEDQSRDFFTALPVLMPKQASYLQKFMNIKKSQGFKLTFLLLSANSKQNTRNLLLALGSWVYRFRKLGMEVRVCKWVDGWGEESTAIGRDFTAAFKEDVTASRTRIETFVNWSEIAVDRRPKDVLWQNTPLT